MIRRLIGLLVLGACIAPLGSKAHDITTRVTWNREISRIFYARCASCHRPDGEAFSLLTYDEANAWTAAIKDSVLSRRMPPWGAVKGFGEFKNDAALTQEEITLIALWVTGGAPEGNPDNLATQPTIPTRPALTEPHDAIEISGDHTFTAPLTVDGFTVSTAPNTESTQITIRFPDGHIEPLVWLYHFQPRQEPFLLRAPLTIPAGAQIMGLSGAKLSLLAAKKHSPTR